MAIGDVCALEECRKLVPPERGNNAIYCEPKHARRSGDRRAAMRKKMAATPRAYTSTSERNRGPLYRRVRDLGMEKSILLRTSTDKEFADMLGTNSQTIKRIRSALQEDLVFEELASEWLGPAADLLEDFPSFRTRFFRTERNEPYVTTDYHMRWINAILETIETGGRQLILSPPRHGKTDLLIHFCVWMIAKNPNVRILWVGPNVDRATQSVQSVADHLERNEDLKATFLKPGEYWRAPKRGGESWTSSQFRVANRTVVGIKGNTMMAVSRGGTLDSLDADFIIADDLESFKSTATEGARESTRRWFTVDIGSRKMEHTAWITIGSRHHPDDLYEHLLHGEGWDPIVETAHNLDCEIPEANVKQHTDCMLWPEVRTFRWLMEQKNDSRKVGQLALFEMVYFNAPTASSILVFNRTDMESCLNHNRSLGEMPTHFADGVRHQPNLKLVAGLDPASTGYQAAWLWGFDLEGRRQYLIDLDNERGGGVIPAHQIIEAWYERYGLKHWVIEENAAFKSIRQDRLLSAYAQEKSIRLEPTETHRNKWDARFGVTALAGLYAGQIVDLPYADPASQSAVEQVIRQHLAFTLADSRTPSDLIMASWFPQKVWRRMIKEADAATEVSTVNYEPSFTNYAANSWNEAPWR